MKLLKSLAFGVAMGLALVVTFVFVMVLCIGSAVVAESYGMLGGVTWGVVAFAAFIAMIDTVADR